MQGGEEPRRLRRRRRRLQPPYDDEPLDFDGAGEHGKAPEENPAPENDEFHALGTPPPAVEEGTTTTAPPPEDAIDEEEPPTQDLDAEPAAEPEAEEAPNLFDAAPKEPDPETLLVPDDPYAGAPDRTGYPFSLAAEHVKTSYSLFRDPNRFSPAAIQRAPHVVKNVLQGRLWLDANRDGKRGGSTETVNAMEEGTGIGGVSVQLVRCETNEPVFQTVSLPAAGGPNRASLARRDDVPAVGLYEIPLDVVPAGRYYAMYQAPTDTRILGNVLPLERHPVEGAYFACTPGGGEGDGYLAYIEEYGDLNWGGYCARSIGCFEVGTPHDLDMHFDELAYGDGVDGTANKLVALPSESTLDVGVAEDEWALATYQFSDAQLVLNFPADVDLSSAVPEDFPGSPVKGRLERTLVESFARSASAFTVHGVTVNMARVLDAAPEVHEKQSGRLRGLLRRDDAEQRRVQYLVTIRSSYRPPPYAQLGDIIQESINRDPQGITAPLKERANDLPEVFEHIDGAAARHLTAKAPPDDVLAFERAQIEVQLAASGEGPLESWAIIPVALLAFSIFALVGMLLGRRMFARRVRPKVRRDQIWTEPVLPEGSPDEISPVDEDAKLKRELDSKKEPVVKVARPTLGVNVAEDGALRSVEVQLRRHLEGALIVEVRPGSPAEKAGFEPTTFRSDGSLELGDLITEVNGEKVDGVKDLMAAVEGKSVGEAVRVTIWRKCDERLADEVRVKLASSDKVEGDGWADISESTGGLTVGGARRRGGSVARSFTRSLRLVRDGQIWTSILSHSSRSSAMAVRSDASTVKKANRKKKRKGREATDGLDFDELNRLECARRASRRDDPDARRRRVRAMRRRNRNAHAASQEAQRHVGMASRSRNASIGSRSTSRSRNVSIASTSTTGSRKKRRKSDEELTELELVPLSEVDIVRILCQAQHQGRHSKHWTKGQINKGSIFIS